MFFFNKKVALSGSVLAFALSIANAGFAQSANTMSDDDYLAALGTMSTEMDLNGLASQTFDPVAVVAPQLPAVAGAADIEACNTLRAQAEKAGNTLVVLASDTSMSASERATFPKCLEQDTGAIVTYMLPNS